MLLNLIFLALKNGRIVLMKEDINMDNLTTLMEMRDENCYLEELLELEKYLEVRKFKVMERLNYLRNRISERESINENNT
jgi:hypothetical protein